MECVVEDRDQHIRELGRQLKQIHGGDSIISEPLRHPPGVPRRTASLGVQTSGAAYLPSLNVEDIKGDTKASVNVNEVS